MKYLRKWFAKTLLVAKAISSLFRHVLSVDLYYSN